MKKHFITIEQYHEFEEDNLGLCVECGSEREMCEPDAEKYQCETCGKHAVYGSASLLFMGHVQ
jgi:hypothetical protein